jgi:hypothetical protein
MEYSVELEKALIPVCTNPACPSYSLLQISVEQMPKESK